MSKLKIQNYISNLKSEKKQLLRLGLISVVAVTVGATVFYAALRYKTVEYLETERKWELSRKAALINCLSGANEDYKFSWSANCRNLEALRSGGLENFTWSENCTLPASIAEKIEKSRKKDIDRCFEQIYGIKD